MNVIDKVVNFFSPATAMKRVAARKISKILNYGYDESGASGTKKSMRGWNAISGSAKDDIDMNLTTLRNRSRSLFMGAPLATSAIRTTRTNVVGSGLKLNPRPDADFLGLSAEEAVIWKKKVEREFSLWADSVHCDSLKLNNFYELQQIAFTGWLLNGDSFTLIKFDKYKSWMPYTLRLHVIESDRIGTPQDTSVYFSSLIESVNPKNNNPIYSGVEVDKNSGAVVAYWVRNTYPQTNNGIKTEWARVTAFGDNTGRQNIIHLMECERAEQRRGVPFLAPVIETLKQLTRYTEAELMASVVAGMFTVFVKSESPSSEQPLGTMLAEEDKVAYGELNMYEMGNGAVNVLNPGESVDIANPGRPNTAFDGFVTAMARYIGAALEIPQELLQKSFMSSYSASRAALLEAWKMFRMRRTWMSKDFNQPIYEEWLSEAIASGRIDAPGFFIDPVVRNAWCRAEWNGPAPGQVDPLKEVNAAEKRINLCLTTRERETIELTGGDFDSNIDQLAREKAKLDELLPQNDVNKEPNKNLEV